MNIYKYIIIEEIYSLELGKIAVVPLAGTWIEISKQRNNQHTNKSFPSRERGLKYIQSFQRFWCFGVVPLAGTWIEIHIVTYLLVVFAVVPLAGTWIEISWSYLRGRCLKSFPSRERGLKFVAALGMTAVLGRSPRGNVD